MEISIIKSNAKEIGDLDYATLFATNDSWIITRNTILYNAVFILLNITIPVILAILLNELRSKFLPKLYQSAMFFPFFLSIFIRYHMRT
ncbi:hypothetical protein PghCCS26_32970 [Paenibacillus glycanilyticus]|uniref:Uncharacterized protein n=1 Tax=Paenibacillus glycanilyticus TaxID=126569 RepID=A0ABQ6NM53_9BACL|nr:hypothetical protein PghCCS26_32970 [Paenibacillus glycanilyticus]